ncbi:hypothetical protein A1O7_06366 [Cladophialophora yegresii CBS 114405]|uniref:Uncharacterized protein n=1 Tax=Cladophialophora yegresii CBS 114405 TaxID=1182544 RepID=W9W1S6_9EURO|nr:uncharacterized protein A1O7_06366 [Cladophialophora yegresii CBS 114405]EXJ58935.1 hypothetical protein A1O7_06366 [Cladophialophora yegresii CBS 114405]
MFRRRENRRSAPDLGPHFWELSWTAPTSSKHPKTVIPDPSTFRDSITPSLENAEQGSSRAYPTPGHLAANLALIECFLNFKNAVTTTRNLDILDVPTYSNAQPPEKRATAPEGAQATQRWNTVVRLAISRFHIWFENIESLLRHAAAYHRYGANSSAHHAAITADYLPPLDVLMVWYAYMNHPSSYRDDNLAHSSPKLLEIPMPWEAILAVIDLDTCTYRPPLAAQKLFTTTTTQSADILVYLRDPPPYSNLEPHMVFSVDLASAVHGLFDGANFIPQMHALLWLRSPSLEGTLARALARYTALPEATGLRASTWFARVKADLALELVWRTHMLYPMAFAAYSNGVFGSDALVVMDGEEPDHEQPDLSSSSTEKLDLTQTWSEGNADSELCYCWTCERIRDEVPNYTYRPSSASTNMSPNRGTPSSSRNPVFPRESADVDPLLCLTTDQISEIKADVAFHRHVEAFRQSNPPGTPLPTRPLTARAMARLKQEQDSKERAGRYYGTGYKVEVIRPAVYDPSTGELLKKEKTKVTRAKNASATGKWGGGLLGI